MKIVRDIIAEQIYKNASEGKQAVGQATLLKHIEGHRLTQQQAIHAKCYDCMGYYSDGKVDCLIPNCPLYPFMPYNPYKDKSRAKNKPKQDVLCSGEGAGA